MRTVRQVVVKPPWSVSAVLVELVVLLRAWDESSPAFRHVHDHLGDHVAHPRRDTCHLARDRRDPNPGALPESDYEDSDHHMESDLCHGLPTSRLCPLGPDRASCHRLAQMGARHMVDQMLTTRRTAALHPAILDAPGLRPLLEAHRGRVPEIHAAAAEEIVLELEIVAL